MLTRLSVTLKVETFAENDATVIRLTGWLRAEYLPELRAKIGSDGDAVVLQMAEVTLVDVEAERLSTGALCREEVSFTRVCDGVFRA